MVHKRDAKTRKPRKIKVYKKGKIENETRNCQVVKGKIDRPMGSFHPRHKDLYYPVNYGYVSGLLGGDGAEQDIYLLGVKSAEQEFTGKVIAVYHRYDDNETKWIVVPCDDEGIVLEDVEIPTDNEIYAQIAFQEQFFCGVLVK